MVKEKIELTLQDESGQEYVAYPFVESEDVTLSNGMDIETMIAQDVSMPIVTHEETSFKIGVGDSDISNSIVDSSVANMTIKGQTYQNILPDPTLRNSMTNGKTMQKLNEGYDSVSTVDGVCKSAILKGNTLINLSNAERINELIPNAIINNMSSIYKPLTTYSIIFNAIMNGGNVVRVQEYLDDEFQGTSMDFNATDGLNIITYTSSNNNFNNIRIRNITSVNIVIRDVIILEGDYTNVDIPYFEGMQSVKVPVLTTTGKNLFSKNKCILYSTTCGYLDLPNNTYTITLIDKDTSVSISNIKLGITSERGEETSGAWWMLANNTVYLKNFTKNGYVSFYPNNEETLDILNKRFYIQIEQGTVATTYEPYKSNILSCELTPMNQSMFEQGTFAESTPPNTQSYESIKLGSEHLYTTRIRTKGTYKVVKGTTYSGQLNNGYGIFICYCKNGLYSAKDKGWIDETNFTFTVPNDCDEMFFAIRKTDNSAITPSDYPLIGLKIHQEVVLRSLPNGVKDTLNLNTGEYVQRIGEAVFDGSETWYSATGSLDGLYERYTINLPIKSTMVLCDKIKGEEWKWWEINGSEPPGEAIFGHSGLVNLNLVVKKENVEKFGSLEAYLQQNPITVQYELATPTIKTVDLSTSGNWEKIVLDGSEYWKQSTANNNYFMETSAIKSNYNTGIENLVFSGDHCLSVAKVYTLNTDTGLCVEKSGGLRIRTQQVLEGQSIGDFKAYLSQNPVTVYYQTAAHQDSTQVKQPIFFKDGHIQLSSGADHSLIPTLDYEAKTSNSYVMDLMKTNTRYTMKAKSASGTFTVDGTQYNFNTNGTFTTPSTMNNKLMIANETVADLMFIEGDVVSKTIPYFKGIKSAFEGEDKIEVLSTGKNLFNLNDIIQGNDADEAGWENIVTNDGVISKRLIQDGGRFACAVKAYVKPSTTYTLSFEHYRDGILTEQTPTYIYHNSGLWGKILAQTNNTNLTFTTKPETEYIVISVNYGSNIPVGETWETKNIQLQENPTVTDYEPYKQNITKIPLLSPLRSLPNGVKDEVILDRENHKAKIIQRVGKVVLNGGEGWNVVASREREKTFLFQTMFPTVDGKSTYCISNNYPHSNSLWTSYIDEGIQLGGANTTLYKMVDLRISKTKVLLGDTELLRNYLKTNPLVVYYELATPVITEVDLNGYPHIYKDGHIFLNTDIAPTSKITYSINQQQQIEASNEDLMRHEKKITNLHKLIGTYVNVEYESTLLALNLELK